jgi:hypothetical protein
MIRMGRLIVDSFPKIPPAAAVGNVWKDPQAVAVHSRRVGGGRAWSDKAVPQTLGAVAMCELDEGLMCGLGCGSPGAD